MKTLRRIFAIATCAAAALTAVACGEPAEKTVAEIQFLYVGYGRDWIDELGKAFNEEYKKQGYEVSIKRMEGDLDAELAKPKKNTTDLYFTDIVNVIDLVNKSFPILKTRDSVLLEDLTESFYNSYAIGKGGKRESVKIKDKMREEALQYTQYYGLDEKWQGRNFTVPWVSAVTGFVVDKALLKNEFGLDVPVTTAELKEDCDLIRNSGTGISPVSTGMKDSYNYWNYVTNVWWAQYSGAEKWENFYKAVPEEGTTKDNGYEVYNDEGMEYAFKVLFNVFTQYNSPEGSGDWTYREVNESLYGGTSVFVVSGDWSTSYIEETYPEKADDMILMKTPIISELGVKLRLDGSTSGEADADKCEEVLRKAVRAIDAGKTNAEIISEVTADCGVTLTGEQVEALRVARGIYYDLGHNHQCMIPSFAEEKDVALLFLRFMASDDGIAIFRKYARAGLPFEYAEPEFDDDCCEMQKNAFDIAKGEYSYSICENDGFSVLRALAGLKKFNGDYWNVNYFSFHDGILNETEKNGLTNEEKAVKAAKKFTEYQYNWTKDNWASLVGISGL